MRHNTTFVVVLTLVLGACGQSPGERLGEGAIEASTGQKAEIDAESGIVTIQTDQGEMKIASGNDATLPATFPKDIFLPEDYRIASAMEMPNAMVLEIDAPGQVAPMFAEADKRMLAEGWKQRMAMQHDANSQTAVYEKEKRNVTLSMYNNEGKGVKLGVQVSFAQ
jgi:hypothetical protein